MDIMEGDLIGIHYDDPASEPIIPYASSLSGMLGSTGYTVGSLVAFSEFDIYQTGSELMVQWNTDETRIPALRPIWGESALCGSTSDYHIYEPDFALSAIFSHDLYVHT